MSDKELLLGVVVVALVLALRSPAVATPAPAASTGQDWFGAVIAGAAAIIKDFAPATPPPSAYQNENGVLMGPPDPNAH